MNVLPTELTTPNYKDVPVEDLEQIRPRLNQLNHSLTKLQDYLLQQKYSPNNVTSSTSIQNQLNVIIQQLASISKTLQTHKMSLQNILIYPNNKFNSMSGLQNSLLRMKFTPEVETWMKKSKTDAQSNNSLTSSFFKNEDAFTSQVANYAREKLDDFIFGGYLTRKDVDDGVSIQDVMGKLLDEEDEEDGDKTTVSTSTKGSVDDGSLERFIYQGIWFE